MEETVFKERHLHLSLNRQKRYVKLVWYGFAMDDQYREGCSLAWELIGKHGLTGWVADLREMRIISEKDQEWTNAVLFPGLLSTSLKRMAVINSKSFGNQHAVEKIFKAGRVNFETGYFNEMEEARLWVQGLPMEH